ncbi:hypothetical protein [Moorena sp. SIO2C4]|uniref:hypothetical protein n=1 Tax=Moorena sp. SIO2C4 TaxID=2607824 RepID=UPI0013CABB69|nr:hypothetical protein [Moorena sp. SIO2C4]NES42964.1 hypothetical protein [Moorena sp. SIO2C4]
MPNIWYFSNILLGFRFTFNLQPINLQPINLQPPTFNLQFSTLNIQLLTNKPST